MIVLKLKSEVFIRLVDFLVAGMGLVLVSPLLCFLMLIGKVDTGSPIFRQARLGRNKKPFTIVKLRTMRVGTASVPTHFASASEITSFGSFLRRTKLDELPQLWNVLKGEMSLVGPRPGLANQTELTAAREEYDVFAVRPGITGLSQINEIDMSTPELLAMTDAEMIRSISLTNYFKYIFLTLIGKGGGDKVR